MALAVIQSTTITTGRRRDYHQYVVVVLIIISFIHVSHKVVTSLVLHRVDVSRTNPSFRFAQRRSLLLLQLQKKQQEQLTDFPSTTRTVENEQSDDNDDGHGGYDELQRFRNRAAFAEHVLKIKMKDYKLVKKKLLVLQDVVQRLQQRLLSQRNNHNNKKNMQQQQQQRRQSYDLELEIGVQNNETTAATTKWKEEQSRRIQLEVVLGNLQNDLYQSRRDLEMQRQSFETNMTHWQEHYEMDRTQWQDQEKNTLQRQELEIEILHTKVLDLNQSLQTAQEELAQRQQVHQRQDHHWKDLLQKEQELNQQLQAQLAQAVADKDQIVLQMEQVSTFANESVLIATASVQAAQRRERALQEQVNALLQEQLSMQINGSRVDQPINQTITASEESNNSNNNITAAKLHQLQMEVNRLENQLRMERLTAASQKRIDRRQFEEALARQRDQYEAAAATATSYSRMGWNVIPEFKTPNTHNNNNNNKGGRGLWHRLRSRLSKRPWST